jgi:hypothetical protein
MPLLEAVQQLQSQGLSDADISQQLLEQGYNAKDINDAINQAKIKDAIQQDDSQAPQQQTGQEMQPSVMEVPEQQYQYQQQDYQQPPQEQYAQGQAMPQEQQYYEYPQIGITTETVTEIAEQVITEKMASVKKQTDALSDFKTLSESRTISMDERLKRIEMIIEKLQMTILGKVGEYGQAFQDIRSEMTGMQESFSKVVNPLVDKARGKKQEIPAPAPEFRRPEKRTESGKPVKQDKAKKQETETVKEDEYSGFENYLR